MSRFLKNCTITGLSAVIKSPEFRQGLRLVPIIHTFELKQYLIKTVERLQRICLRCKPMIFLELFVIQTDRLYFTICEILFLVYR